MLTDMIGVPRYYYGSFKEVTPFLTCDSYSYLMSYWYCDIWYWYLTDKVMHTNTLAYWKYLHTDRLAYWQTWKPTHLRTEIKDRRQKTKDRQKTEDKRQKGRTEKGENREREKQRKGWTEWTKPYFWWQLSYILS